MQDLQDRAKFEETRLRDEIAEKDEIIRSLKDHDVSEVSRVESNYYLILLNL